MKYWKDLFKKHILQRGEDYFYNGAVIELNKTESGYQAVVEGIEDYEVAIEIDNDVVADMDCSCPYAAEGKNCKHMAAVLFQIESEEPSVIIDNELPGETDSLVDVIASISEDEAKILLLHQAAKDPVLKSSIMLKYSKEIGKAQVKDIKFRIDCLEDEFCDRDGFINYRNAWDYGCALNNILESEVQLLIDRNLLMPAFEVSNHVFYTVATCELDDSDGTTNFVAEACYDMWKQIIDKASADETEKMFQWFKTHRKGYVIDYMQDYIDNILMNEFHDDSMLREKIELLDSEIRELQKQENGDNWFCKRYQYSHKIMQRLSMMKELGDSLDTQFEYAKRFRWQSDVRKWEVSEYLKIGNIEMAISVLKESCELDKDYPGIVSNHIRQGAQELLREIKNIVCNNNSKMNKKGFQEFCAVLDLSEVTSLSDSSRPNESIEVYDAKDLEFYKTPEEIEEIIQMLNSIDKDVEVKMSNHKSKGIITGKIKGRTFVELYPRKSDRYRLYLRIKKERGTKITLPDNLVFITLPDNEWTVSEKTSITSEIRYTVKENTIQENERIKAALEFACNSWKNY